MARASFPAPGTMRIDDVIVEDSGIYACIARNSRQGITYRVALNVLGEFLSETLFRLHFPATNLSRS